MGKKMLESFKWLGWLLKTIEWIWALGQNVRGLNWGVILSVFMTIWGYLEETPLPWLAPLFLVTLCGVLVLVCLVDELRNRAIPVAQVGSEKLELATKGPKDAPPKWFTEDMAGTAASVGLNARWVGPSSGEFKYEGDGKNIEEIYSFVKQLHSERVKVHIKQRVVDDHDLEFGKIHYDIGEEPMIPQKTAEIWAKAGICVIMASSSQ